MRFVHGVIAVCLATTLATTAGAETILLATSSSRLALFRSQIKLIDTRLSREYTNSDRLQPKRADGGDGTLPRYGGNYRGAWYEQARAFARFQVRRMMSMLLLVVRTNTPRSITQPSRRQSSS